MVSSYILVFAGLLRSAARLADVYDRRRLFVAGLTVFTLAGLAGSMLIAAHLAQGLGAALIVPTAQAAIVAAFDNPRERTHGSVPGPRSGRSRWHAAGRYHAGLALTIVLVAAGVVISYLALRRLPAPARSIEPVAADEVAADGVAGDGVAAGPELAGRPS